MLRLRDGLSVRPGAGRAREREARRQSGLREKRAGGIRFLGFEFPGLQGRHAARGPVYPTLDTSEPPSPEGATVPQTALDSFLAVDPVLEAVDEGLPARLDDVLVDA